MTPAPTYTTAPRSAQLSKAADMNHSSRKQDTVLVPRATLEKLLSLVGLEPGSDGAAPNANDEVLRTFPAYTIDPDEDDAASVAQCHDKSFWDWRRVGDCLADFGRDAEDPRALLVEFAKQGFRLAREVGSDKADAGAYLVAARQPGENDEEGAA